MKGNDDDDNIRDSDYPDKFDVGDYSLDKKSNNIDFASDRDLGVNKLKDTMSNPFLSSLLIRFFGSEYLKLISLSKSNDSNSKNNVHRESEKSDNPTRMTLIRPALTPNMLPITLNSNIAPDLFKRQSMFNNFENKNDIVFADVKKVIPTGSKTVENTFSEVPIRTKYFDFPSGMNQDFDHNTKSNLNRDPNPSKDSDEKEDYHLHDNIIGENFEQESSGSKNNLHPQNNVIKDDHNESKRTYSTENENLENLYEKLQTNIKKQLDYEHYHDNKEDDNDEKITNISIHIGSVEIISNNLSSKSVTNTMNSLYHENNKKAVDNFSESYKSSLQNYLKNRSEGAY